MSFEIEKDGLIDIDIEKARRLRQKKMEEKEKDFSKVINKKAVSNFEMDEMFLDFE